MPDYPHKIVIQFDNMHLEFEGDRDFVTDLYMAWYPYFKAVKNIETRSDIDTPDEQ